MKYACLVVLAALTLCAGACDAKVVKDAAAGEGVIIEKPIDVGPVKEKPVEEDYGVGSEGEREMPSRENYDPNTGLPNVVPSDSDGEME